MADLDALQRIERALLAAADLLRGFDPERMDVERKAGGDPVTEADRAVDDLLRGTLPRDGEGWLSEETRDDGSRLGLRRVWVVDPLDGTREFVAGIPEWCVSIALVEDGAVVAGGTCNPLTQEIFLGAAGSGLRRNALPVTVSRRAEIAGALVLASRSEVGRGEWEGFRDAPFEVWPTGSVAYKLSRVAAGLADATWSLVAKHEWDVAAGIALVQAAGGVVRTFDGSALRFNSPDATVPGLLAANPALAERLIEFLRDASR